MLTVCFLLQTQADQSPTYKYLVKFISPTKKSKYITRVWHGVGNVFESLIQLQEKLMEDFPDKLPSSPTFEVGYIEKRNNAKRWIEGTADLTAMYHIFQPGSTVTIWCESKDDSTSTDVTNTTAIAGRKHKITSEKDTGGSSSKRTSLSHEEDVDEFMEKLRDKHLEEGKYTEPQLRLWARMLARGHHQSLEDPPNIPLITGAVATKKTPRRDELSDVVVTAMKAASQYFSVATKPSDQLSLNLESTPRAAAGISPSSKAKISGMYLSHLKSLQDLRASGTLTEEEFIEQKKYALQSIKGLNDK